MFRAIGAVAAPSPRHHRCPHPDGPTSLTIPEDRGIPPAALRPEPATMLAGAGPPRALAPAAGFARYAPRQDGIPLPVAWGKRTDARRPGPQAALAAITLPAFVAPRGVVSLAPRSSPPPSPGSPGDASTKLARRPVRRARRVVAHVLRAQHPLNHHRHRPRRPSTNGPVADIPASPTIITPRVYAGDVSARGGLEAHTPGGNASSPLPSLNGQRPTRGRPGRQA